MTTFDPSVPNPIDELAARVARLEEFNSKVDAALHRVGIFKKLEEPVAPPAAPPVAPPMVQPPKPMAEREIALTRLASMPKARTATDERVDAFSIEKLIGGRWLAAAGAVIVVIGVGLFLKLAYDLGWLGGFSPGAKCGLGALFGAAMMGAGEVVRRRVNALGSVGLFASGLGTMYASAFAAHATYGLVGPIGAMALLVGCVALGIVIGSLTNLAAVAVLSLLGGYLTQFILWKSSAAPWFLPVYLLALLAVSLVLSGWKSVRLPWFGSLRTVAWWGTLLIGGVWVLDRADRNWDIALPFLAAVWAATHFERFFSAGRNDRRGVRRGTALGSVSFSDARLIAGSLSTTAWCALLAIVTVEVAHLAPTWYVPALLCAVTVLFSFKFAGHRRVFTEIPRASREKLGVGMVVQSGALLIAAVALAFSGWVQVAAGLSLGVAAVVAGRWMNSRALDYYGMAVLAFASVTLAAIMVFDAPASPTYGYSMILFGLAGTEWSWRVLMTAGAWLITAGLFLVRNPSAHPVRAMVSAAAGIVGLMLAFVHPRTDAGSLCVYWGAVGLLAAAAPSIIGRLRLREMSLAVFLASFVAWTVAFPVDGWNETNSAIALHPGLLSALGLGAAWLFASRRVAMRIDDKEPREVVIAAAWAVAGLLVFVSTSFEVARAAGQLANDSAVQRSAVSIYWGVFSVGLLLVGFLARSARTRYVGLALINIAAAKVVLLDLSGAPPAWRIASFIGLGLLMIGTAVAYAKLTARIGRKESEPVADARGSFDADAAP